MSDHHGIDLDAIFKANGGHSVYAPSGSEMWLNCSGSLIPNLLAEDTAGAEAAEGTVGHAVAEEWLLAIKEARDAMEAEGRKVNDLSGLADDHRPDHLVGTVRSIKERHETFDIEITDEMLSYIRQYIDWCIVDDGTHYIEERVFFSELTPLPNQGGTADYFVLSMYLMIITDLKYGKGVQVFAEGNTQARLYALGVFFKYDHIYHFKKIIIRIAQPRLEHFDVWEITREELLEFAEFVRERAALAWVPNAPRTPAPKTCLWCKVKADCAALLAFTHALVDDVFPDMDEEDSKVTVEEDGTITGVTYSVREMTSANTLAEAQRKLDPQHPSSMSTKALAHVVLHRKLLEKWLSEAANELDARARSGEMVPYHKLVDGREGQRKWKNPKTAIEDLVEVGLPEEKATETKVVSPAQAEERLKAEYPRLTRANAGMLIADLVIRAPGRQTLVPDTDRRPVSEDVSDVFDQIDSDDDLWGDEI